MYKEMKDREKYLKERRVALFEEYNEEYSKNPIGFIENILQSGMGDNGLHTSPNIDFYSEECEFLLCKLIQHEFMFMPFTMSLDEEE